MTSGGAIVPLAGVMVPATGSTGSIDVQAANQIGANPCPQPRMMKSLQEDFWNTTVCPTRWKLQVHDAIIRNKLPYGLETVHLTQLPQKKVNASQLPGLRKV